MLHADVTDKMSSSWPYGLSQCQGHWNWKYLRLMVPISYARIKQFWFPCQPPGVMGSVLRLVGPAAVYCDWARCMFDLQLTSEWEALCKISCTYLHLITNMKKGPTFFSVSLNVWNWYSLTHRIMRIKRRAQWLTLHLRSCPFHISKQGHVHSVSCLIVCFKVYVTPLFAWSLELQISQDTLIQEHTPPRWLSGQSVRLESGRYEVDSHLRREDISGVSHTSDLKISTPVAIPCLTPGVIGSALGLVGPVLVYCNWVR